MAIHYTKMQADKPNKPLILDLIVVQKEKDTYIKEESNNLLLSKVSKVDTFIKRLQVSLSHQKAFYSGGS